MSDAASEIPKGLSEAQIAARMWEVAGGKTLQDLPTLLGFQPKLAQVTPNRWKFSDDGLDIQFFLGPDQRIAMIDVRYRENPAK